MRHHLQLASFSLWRPWNDMLFVYSAWIVPNVTEKINARMTIYCASQTYGWSLHCSSFGCVWWGCFSAQSGLCNVLPVLCVDLQNLHLSLANFPEAQVLDEQYLFCQLPLLQRVCLWGFFNPPKDQRDLASGAFTILRGVNIYGRPSWNRTLVTRLRHKQCKLKEFSPFPAWCRLSMSHSHRAVCWWCRYCILPSLKEFGVLPHSSSKACKGGSWHSSLLMVV